MDQVLAVTLEGSAQVLELLWDVVHESADLIDAVLHFFLGLVLVYSTFKYLTWRVVRKHAFGIEARIALAVAYEPILVPCKPADGGIEIAAEVDAEKTFTAGAVGDIEGVEFAEPGTNGHGATRRITRRVKMVHCPYRGPDVCRSHLSDIIAEVRAENYARVRNAHTEQLVRSHLVRTMRRRNLRNVDVDRHLDECVTAVFLMSEAQRWNWRKNWVLEWCGFMVPRGTFSH